jgi:transcriptional regulator with XRE-family HTH domain
MAKDKELNPYLKNLEIALRRIGRSKTWLALECGLSTSAILNLYSRNCYPSVNTAWTISTVLGYTIEEMLKGDVEHYQPAGKSKRDLTTSKIMTLCKELDETELESFQNIMRQVVDFRHLAK